MPVTKHHIIPAARNVPGVVRKAVASCSLELCAAVSFRASNRPEAKLRFAS